MNMFLKAKKKKWSEPELFMIFCSFFENHFKNEYIAHLESKMVRMENDIQILKSYCSRLFPLDIE